MAAAAGAGEPETSLEGVQTIQALQAAILDIMNRDQFDTLGNPIQHRLIIMTGGADFFGPKIKSLRKNPYELDSLVEYLKDKFTTNLYQTLTYHILCFDENYTTETVGNDILNVNRLIFNKYYKQPLNRSLDESALELSIGQGVRYMDDFMPYDSLETVPAVVRGAVYENALFVFVKMNLETDYKDFAKTFPKEIYWNGETLVKTMADSCVPEEGSVMKALETLCTELPFHEYLLYNCAWIKGARYYINKNTGRHYANKGKQNRHFELMCELLNIFMNLGKPAYLLTAKDMNTFVHTNQQKPLRDDFLNVTPLNETTKFKREEWIAISTTGGTRKKARKTRKTKHSRKH